MNTCRYILTCISEENRNSTFLHRFFCAVGLLGLVILPGIFLMALLIGADEELNG